MTDYKYKDLLEIVENCLGILTEEVEFRAKLMFGGAMCYAYGRPFISLSNVGIAVKLSAADRHELLQIDGAKPLRYEPDSPPSKSYTLVPAVWHDDGDKLLEILQLSAAHCQSLPLPKKRKKKLN